MPAAAAERAGAVEALKPVVLIMARLLPALLANRLARLRYPRLFLLTGAVFVLDLFVPDLIPFADEILLGLAAALLGSWKRRREQRRMEHGGETD